MLKKSLAVPSKAHMRAESLSCFTRRAKSSTSMTGLSSTSLPMTMTVQKESVGSQPVSVAIWR